MSPWRSVLFGAALLLACAGCSAQGLFGAARTSCPKPTGLQAAATNANTIALKWQPGAGQAPAGCAGFLVSVQKEGLPAATPKTFGSNVPAATIGGLSPSDTYTIKVQALSRLGFAASDPATLTGVATTVAASKSGFAATPAATTTAGGSPAGASSDSWACAATEGYPVCSAGAAGLCSPITCADMARLGRCAAPYIRVQDWQSHTITQHCAAECGGCAGKAQPRLADSMAPPQEYCCAFGTGAYFSGPGDAAVASS